MQHAEPELTLLLNQAVAGDKQSEDLAYRQVYGELRKLAQAAIRPGGGVSVQVTGLVHDVWLKLASNNGYLLANDLLFELKHTMTNQQRDAAAKKIKEYEGLITRKVD